MSKNIPNHVVVIPDGNRRWAKKKGLASIVGHKVSFSGHQKGASSAEEVIKKALELKIPYLTIWGSSLDNVLKRSKSEISYLYKIFKEEFEKIAEEEGMHKNKVRIEVIGRWKEYFSEDLKKAINNAIEKTKNYDKHVLTFLMAYNGDDEMIECMKILKKKGSPISEKTIKENLWTKNLPKVDLIIRTGCSKDPHNSAGMMMWDTAYSQLYFTDKLFPDFKGKEFEKAIKDFIDRERRLGK